MKRWLILLCFVTACGDGDLSWNNHGFGFHYDAIGPRGLRLRYKPVLPDGHPHADPAAYEAIFDAVQLCTGLQAPMPFVIVEPLNSIVLPDGRQPSGVYYSNPALIRIDGYFSFGHEGIHHLLDWNTGDGDGAHASPHFAACQSAGLSGPDIDRPANFD